MITLISMGRINREKIVMITFIGCLLYIHEQSFVCIDSCDSHKILLIPERLMRRLLQLSM